MPCGRSVPPVGQGREVGLMGLSPMLRPEACYLPLAVSGHKGGKKRNSGGKAVAKKSLSPT